MRFSRVLTVFFSLAALAAAQSGNNYTVLTFSALPGTSLLSGGYLDEAYGDRVAGSPQNGFLYGGGGNYTPVVEVDYEVLPANAGGFSTYATGYGDLVDVLWGSSVATEASFRFTADPGFTVQLYGLDLAPWSGGATTIPQISVRNAMNVVVFQQNNVVLPTALGTHLDLNFNPPLVSEELRLILTLPANGLYSVGIDNIEFATDNPGVGQANSPAASLVVNGVGPLGFRGPFEVTFPVGQALNLDWAGPANQPLQLYLGASNPNNASFPCIGRIDIGTPPSYGDLTLLFSGTGPGVLNSFFRLDASGSAAQSFTIPFATQFAIQGLVSQPSGPCPFVATASFLITVN